MHSGLGQLISFNNVNDMELIGLLFSGSGSSARTSNTIVLHIHGNYGNFYNNKFIWVMSKIYVENGIDFLSFNLSAHDGLCEGYEKETLRYIGGAVVDYGESIIDIEAAVQYAKKSSYSRIILQGHSLGCDKAIHYCLLNPDVCTELILLSPVDSFAVQKKWLEVHKHITIPEQINALKKLPIYRDGPQWVSIDEYGAEGADADWVYRIPVTRNCLLSILEGSAFKYLNLECGDDFYIKNRTLAFLGVNDGLQMSTQNEFKDFLKQHFCELCVVDDLKSDHDLKGVENELTDRIVDWINAF